MSNPNIAQNDVLKIGIASLIISLLLNISYIGFVTANTPDVWNNDNITYSTSLISLLSTQVPTTIYCIEGDETCTNQLASNTASDGNQFDIIQNLLNVGKIIANIITFIGMTLLFPIYITNSLSHYITNAWINGVLAVVGYIWTTINIIGIVRLVFMKK